VTEKIKVAALAGVGAGVGGAGGASVGVLELAALGSATELAAGAVIAAGAAVGVVLFLGGYRVYRLIRNWATVSLARRTRSQDNRASLTEKSTSPPRREAVN
jgi:hypothetical protein